MDTWALGSALNKEVIFQNIYWSVGGLWMLIHTSEFWLLWFKSIKSENTSYWMILYKLHYHSCVLKSVTPNRCHPLARCMWPPFIYITYSHLKLQTLLKMTFRWKIGKCVSFLCIFFFFFFCHRWNCLAGEQPRTNRWGLPFHFLLCLRLSVPKRCRCRPETPHQRGPCWHKTTIRAPSRIICGLQGEASLPWHSRSPHAPLLYSLILL